MPRPLDTRHKSIDLHEGTIAYRDREIFWKENGATGAIEFNLKLKKSHNPLLSLVEVARALESDESDGAQKTIQLNIVNKLLAHFRPHANPDANKYYAAAAGIDALGQLYIAVNNEHSIKNGFEGRGCAETRMLDRYQQKNRTSQAEFKSLYLMSGKVKNDAYSSQGQLTDEHPGAIACLCGECRRNLRPHMDNGIGGRFIMVPTNDGSMELSLNSTAKTIGELKPGQAWEILPEMMYPLPKTMPCVAKATKEVLKGYDLLRSAKSMPPLKTKFPTINWRNGGKGNTGTITRAHYVALVNAIENPVMGISVLHKWPEFELENINRSLLHMVKDAYDAHKNNVPPGKNLKITAIIVKSNERLPKFYPTPFVEGEDWLPSKPNRFAVALSNAANRVGISDVYVMNVDVNKLITLKQQTQGIANVHYEEAMPDPAEIGRLLKNMRPDDQTNIHFIPLNDGLLKEAELKEIMLGPRDVRKDLGPGFDSPKKMIMFGMC